MPQFAASPSAATTNKSKRLQILVERDVELPKQKTEASFVAVQQEAQPAPPISDPRQSPDFGPRHWHDPCASKAEAQKRAKVAKKPVKPSTQNVRASVAKECPNGWVCAVP